MKGAEFLFLKPITRSACLENNQINDLLTKERTLKIGHIMKFWWFLKLVFFEDTW